MFYTSRAMAGVAAILLLVTLASHAAEVQPLAGTAALTIEGDIASQMVDGVDRFLMKQIERAAAGREQFWKRDFSSVDAYDKSIAENRARLGQILGVRDARPARVEMELVASVDRPALMGKSAAFEAYAVRWRAFGEVHGEGLLLKPIGVAEPVADVIAIPDADQTPEMIAGLDATTAPEQKFARHLVESGCRVIVPALLNRKLQTRSPSGRGGGPELSNREFVYRSAFELGRHVLGYEVEKVLAAVDWSRRENPARPVAVFGYGEGGMLALFAAALDTRIELTGVAGYFNAVEATFEQPIERNVFGLNQRFGDAELALMVWPRRLVIEDAWGPEVKVRGRGAAPGQLSGQLRGWDELERAASLADPTRKTDKLTIGMVVQKNFPFGREAALKTFLEHFHATLKTAPEPKVLVEDRDPAERQLRQLHELDRHNQQLLAASAGTRHEFMKKLDTSSLEKYEQSTRAYRNTFHNDVLGRFDQPLLPLNPRTRRIYDTDKFAGYEVALDVFPDVIAYGILLLPKDLREGEKRPVVVCQHGLEGRPQETITGDSKYYHDFAAKLAERGFITFSPQNLYIFGDRFRVLGRKANPIGKTIWSIIIPQHQQILNFLKTLPNVDAKRIGFYGLSYGGKTAMRVPAVLTDYCLSICSGDFNEWVVKNASTALPMSYVFSPEYEIFEWDLGSTFNYAEMAALIAPRPFMVERGHFDGVSTDEYVAFEFAKVRRLYNGQLKIGERCEIEFFDGPHTINGKGTFEFLHKHLNWEKR